MSTLKELKEGIMSTLKQKLTGKHPVSGMTDDEANSFLKKHNVKFTHNNGYTGYEWKSPSGKSGYEEYKHKTNSDGVAFSHQDRIHRNVIPEIQSKEAR